MIIELFVFFVLALILWRYVIIVAYIYYQFGKAFGFNKVTVLYKPFTGVEGINQWSTKKYNHSYGYIFEAIKKNPFLKVMIIKLALGLQTIIFDAEMMRKMTNEYYKQLPKPNFMIFNNEIQMGLVFTQGALWKKSRSILSQLFHFEMLRARESMIQDVIDNNIKDLDKQKPHLFKLGCSIGGEVVVKSLFGEEFFEYKFNDNNPFEEIQQLLACLVAQTRKVPHLLRLIIFGKVRSESKYLLQSQKEILQRLLIFKQICRQFIIKSKVKYQKKQLLPSFLEAYFKQNDDSYHEEMIHQLFLFLFAGEDTTGSLIQKCLAMLATYPQYQQKILTDIQKSNVYSSKQLNNFINEVNRNQGPISLAIRRTVLQPFTIDGYTFQKDQRVTMAIGAPMMNPRYWDNPEKFDPSRFNKPIQNPMAFIPFSSGPRNCIGQHMALMQVKLALKSILQKYTLHKQGNSLATYTNTIINYLVDPYYVRFQKKI